MEDMEKGKKMTSAKTLLVLGASGLTGYKSMQLAKKRFEAYGTINMRKLSSPDKSLLQLDITKEDLLRKSFSEIRPDIVLNTTALHNVDYCESHQDEAFNINTKVVGLIASLCNNLGSRLIHISTDFVFDGEKKGSYSESDVPNPQSVYAKSKLEGEVQAKKAASYSILRPSVVYGWTPLEIQGSISSSGKPMNFALWALSKMNKSEELKVVNDQYTSPTLADVLAAIALRVAVKETNDLYHVSGTSCMSRYEFTRKIAATMGYLPDIIQAIESKSIAQAAKRPMNSCLNCEKLQNELNYKLLNIDQSLAVMRSQIEIESPSILGN
jgi:dTDP-4-dehydrorhamnose reductase